MMVRVQRLRDSDSLHCSIRITRDALFLAGITVLDKVIFLLERRSKT